MTTRLANLACVGILTLLAPAAALAQEAAPDDGAPAADDQVAPEDGDGDAVGDGADGAAVEAPAPVVEAPAPAAAAPYPQRALNRPRTLPGGSFQGSVVVNSKDTFGDYASAATLLYSPVDRLQLLGAYKFGIEPSDFAPAFVVAARYYSYKKPPHLFHSVQVTLPFDFSENDAGERTGLDKINLSTPIKYKFNDTVGVFFGDALIDVLIQPEFGLALNVPFTLGVQANDHVFLTAATNFAKIAISNAGETEHIGDRIPLTLNALYAFDYTFDVVAAVNLGDLMDFQGEAVTAIVGINYRGGFAR